MKHLGSCGSKAQSLRVAAPCLFLRTEESGMLPQELIGIREVTGTPEVPVTEGTRWCLAGCRAAVRQSTASRDREF